MEKIRLGRTGLMVSRSGFGALPIQRISMEESDRLLRKAYENGINFFDTAHAYTDSEEKIGHALSDVRKDIILATKFDAKDVKGFWEQLENSLKMLKTDYIDIYQAHNPSVLSDPNDDAGLYAAMCEAKKKGYIRFLGITNHSFELATKAAQSGCYDTIQFPLSSLSSDDDLRIIEVCKQHDLGVIAMKAISGGLITDVSTTFSFLRQYDNVVPIWGVQKESELDDFLALEKNPPALDEAMWEKIRKDRAELSGNFCRGCGYCLPCPAGIEIPTAARMSLLLRRSPYQPHISKEGQEKMNRIENCIGCGACKSRCPYHLDTPNLLKYMLKDYREFSAAHADEIR